MARVAGYMAALLLCGCGGGGNGDMPSQDPVDGSASSVQFSVESDGCVLSENSDAKYDYVNLGNPERVYAWLCAAEGDDRRESHFKVARFDPGRSCYRFGRESSRTCNLLDLPITNAPGLSVSVGEFSVFQFFRVAAPPADLWTVGISGTVTNTGTVPIVAAGAVFEIEGRDRSSAFVFGAFSRRPLLPGEVGTYNIGRDAPTFSRDWGGPLISARVRIVDAFGFELTSVDASFLCETTVCSR